MNHFKKRFLPTNSQIRIFNETTNRLIESDDTKILIPGVYSSSAGALAGQPITSINIEKNDLVTPGIKIIVINTNNNDTLNVIVPGFGDGGNVIGVDLGSNIEVKPNGTMFITFIGNNNFYITGDLVTEVLSGL